MGLEKLKMTLVGESPLIMHNGQLANPLNKWSKALKELTSKRGKTDSDMGEISQVEWRGGLYQDPKGVIGLPEDVVLGALIAGAKKSKNGKKAMAAMFGARPFFHLVYEGPKDIDALAKDERFSDYRLVVIQSRRVMRARPRFDSWKLPIELMVNTSLMNKREVIMAAEACGEQVGLCDFRPRYGRFSVEA